MARTCGSCILCCKVMGVEALEKPQGVWCSHCAPRKGCVIYDRRPGECAAFRCAWLANPNIGEEWHPVRSKIVLVVDETSRRILAHVDPGAPEAWRKSPYKEQLLSWMQKGLPTDSRVYIAIDGHYTLLLPDGEHDVGRLGPDDRVDLAQVHTALGPRWTVRLRKAMTTPPAEMP